MGSFDAELKNSIRDLQTQMAALTSQTDKGNQSLRTMQAEVRSVGNAHRVAAAEANVHARGVESVSHSVHGLGKAARLAGGEGGHLLHQLGKIASLNPLLLGAGVGIAALINGFEALKEKAAEARKEVEELAESAAKAGHNVDKAASAALNKADVRALRKRAFEQAEGGTPGLSQFDVGDRDAARDAAQTAALSGVVTEEEALKNLHKSGAFNKGGQETAFSGRRKANSANELAAIAAGREASEGDDFAALVRQARGSDQGLLATAAENRQAQIKVREEGASDDLLRRATGYKSGSSLLDVARSSDTKLNETLTKMEETMRTLAERIKSGGDSRWSFQSSLEAQLQETRSSYDTIISNVTSSIR